MRTRLGLGLAPASRVGLLLVPVGIALGPEGIGLLTPGTLSLLEPAMPVACAAVGLFAGLGLDLRRRTDDRLLVAASQEALTTALLVAGGVLVFQHIAFSADRVSWQLALLLGICAASSASRADETPDSVPSPAARIGELDDVLPIVVGGVTLAVALHGGDRTVAWLILQAVLLAAVFAFAGCLLVAQTSSETEQRVFVVGTLLLLGGAAAYLSLSALVAGFIAGVLWNAVGGAVREHLERSVRGLQHPLVALLLLVAGARCRFSAWALGVAAVYLALRIAGKLAGAWLSARTVVSGSSPSLGLQLVSPGVVAVAFALNALQLGPADVMEVLLTAVVLGSIGSELLAWAAARPPVAE